MYLSIDVGTQSVRAILFDQAGHILGIGRRALAPPEAPKPGWAEFHPEQAWHALVDAVEDLSRRTGPLSQIASISLTCQRGTVVGVDRFGSPIYPAISWMDQRMTENPPDIPRWLRLIFLSIGQARTLDYFRQQAEINWLYAHQPQQWKKIDKFLLLSAYLNHRLTGRYRDSYANTVGYLPFDYKRLRWAPKGDWRWKALALTPEMMPELVAPGAMIGTLTDEAAQQLNLPRRLPVIAGAADKACESLGCGVFDHTRVSISLGTTLTINATSRDYRETLPLLPPFPAAIAGHYSNEYMISRGFWMIRWFIENFGHPEQQKARMSGGSVEDALNHLLRQTPPGNDGVMALPYWNPGVIHPGVTARGTLVGLTADHSSAHIYRALIEGLAYETRYGLERLKKRLKLKDVQLVVAGGGSQNPEVLQIFADILSQPLYRPQTSEASGLGAAMLQTVGLRHHPDWQAAQTNMCRVNVAAEPNRNASRLYQQLYEKVYVKLHRQVAPLHTRLFKIGFQAHAANEPEGP